MLAKLTLTVDQAVIEGAKAYAQKKNRSVSRIVEEQLRNIISDDDIASPFLAISSPITDSISGMFKDNGKSYKDMKDEALKDRYL